MQIPTQRYDLLTKRTRIMRFRIIITYICIIITALSSLASPARRGALVLTQPDGTTFRAFLQGDEFANIKTTYDGHAIIQDEDGWWCYAVYEDDGSRCSSGYRIGKEVPSSILSGSRNIPRSVISENGKAKRLSVNTIESDIRPSLTNFSTPARRNGIVILAQFKDIKFLHGKEDFQTMLMSDDYSLHGATGSAREYFESQFNGRINFSFDVSEIVTLPAKREYYGKNDSRGNDSRPAEMISDACRLAAENGVDFSRYDSNNDGKVDNVFVFFAGEDEAEGADENCIWSHSWYLFSGAGISLNLNGKMIDRYACTSEMTRIYDLVTGKLQKTRLSGIGTFCHEYSHTFGLPDLYDTDYESHGGWAAGVWGSTSLMDSGNQNNDGNTPPNFNVIEREILGLTEPVVIDTDGRYSLCRIETNIAYRINTDRKDEYYLLEYRSNDGTLRIWDKYIGGNGMLVYHIDKSTSVIEKWEGLNTVNTKADHQCADLIEADGRSDSFTDYMDFYVKTKNIEGIFFPYKKLNSIPSQGTPGLNFWSGQKNKISITEIQEDGGVIRFNVLGFSEDSTPPSIKGDITYEAFCDGVILRFESDKPHIGHANINFGLVGGETWLFQVAPYENGKYAIKLEGLEPVKTYTATIYFELFGIKGKSSSVSFMTKKQPAVTWPFISFGSAQRNSDGTFEKGTRIPLKVNNSRDIIDIVWSFNNEVVPKGDYYLTLTEDGTLEAHIYMKDGCEEILTKEIRTSPTSVK